MAGKLQWVCWVSDLHLWTGSIIRSYTFLRCLVEWGNPSHVAHHPPPQGWQYNQCSHIRQNKTLKIKTLSTAIKGCRSVFVYTAHDCPLLVYWSDFWSHVTRAVAFRHKRENLACCCFYLLCVDPDKCSCWLCSRTSLSCSSDAG